MLEQKVNNFYDLKRQFLILVGNNLEQWLLSSDGDYHFDDITDIEIDNNSHYGALYGYIVFSKTYTIKALKDFIQEQIEDILDVGEFNTSFIVKDVSPVDDPDLPAYVFKVEFNF